jgi:hypothetical protein
VCIDCYLYSIYIYCLLRYTKKPISHKKQWLSMKIDLSLYLAIFIMLGLIEFGGMNYILSVFWHGSNFALITRETIKTSRESHVRKTLITTLITFTTNKNKWHILRPQKDSCIDIISTFLVVYDLKTFYCTHHTMSYSHYH